jgi:hypothetical protein
MRFRCHPVDASFFETAPMRFKNVVELDGPPADAFAILEDEASWPGWFRGMRKVVWTSREPHAVGATRTVSLALVTIDEYFFRWESGRRFSFYVTGQTVPLAKALAEDYLLEQSGPGKTRFTYSVAIEPSLALAMGGPAVRAYFGSMFRNAAAGLQSYVAKARAQNAPGD